MFYAVLFMKTKFLAALAAKVLAAFLFLAAPAAAQTSFFQGKTITIVQGRDPGGTGDLRVRALVPFL